MKNKGIAVIIIALAAVIVLLVTIDFSSTRVDKRPDNPYEYEVDEFKEVPEEVIHYKETKQLRIPGNVLKGLTYHEGRMFIISDRSVRVVDLTGTQLNRFELNDSARCIHVTDNQHILIGHDNYFSLYNHAGEPLQESEKLKKKSIITSIAKKGDTVFVADAGNRRIVTFSIGGQKLGEFLGVSGSSAMHGFIIPSAKFDIAVNKEKELWTTNPGIHALQHYSEDGNLENKWSKSSMNYKGFSGCCNPAHFAFSPNGNFITSEKGMVRIKEYDKKGELIAVVAPPKKFKDEGRAPEVATDESGNIIALDFDKKMVRYFEPK